MIVEDVDYSALPENPIFKQVIISPLRFQDSDGAPVTIMAEVKSED